MTVRARARGAVLIEVVVAISLFSMAALAVLGAVMQGRDNVARAADRAKASDLARSVMALIEAGVLAPEAATGPAPAWDPDTVDLDSPDALLDAFAELSGSQGLDARGWMIDVALEPTVFDGLTLVEVRASLVLGADPDSPEAQATLRQFVRLDPPEEDSVGTVAHLFPSSTAEDGFASRAERMERDMSAFERDRSAFERDDPFAEREDPFANEDDPFAERANRLRRDDGESEGGGGR